MRQLGYPYKGYPNIDTEHVVEFPGVFTVEITGINILELLGEYFSSRFSDRLRELIALVLSSDPRFYEDENNKFTQLPIDAIRAYFIEKLNEQQERINRLPLAPKTIQKLRRARRTFLVENTFDALRTLIASDDRRIRRIFNVRLTGNRTKRKLSVSLNTMYLLRLLAGREFLLAFNENQDAEPGFRAKKKVYGLFLNILLGYRTFVSQVMRRRADPRHSRPGLPHGYFPPIEMEMENVERAGEQDLIRHIRSKHAELINQISQLIIDDIDKMLGGQQ